MSTKRRLLVVDDDDAIRDSLTESLAHPTRDVRAAASATAAMAMLDDWRPDVILSDVRMPGLDGLELLALLTERVPSADVIMMTAFDDMPTVIAAMRGGAVEFLTKPFSLDHLRSVVDRVCDDRARRAGGAIAASQASLDAALVGHDPQMIETFKLIGQAAGSPVTVLIRGESGTGKELVARAIHAHGANASEPFVPVNCAALPTSLLESELFGHVRGAFTGATQDRRGRFALAGRGTIFLDEIGDTTPDFQSKLLRVLEDRQFQPVGSERTERTEARVISATHRNLETMVAEGSFRNDLYFRLRIFELLLPPLRERLVDLPLLADHLLARTAAAMGTQPAVLSDDAIQLLAAHHWPGNVRELENCLIRGAIAARGGVIRAAQLNLSSSPASGMPLGTLDAAERDHLVRVYNATQRHKVRTAEILGVSRPRLDRLLHKHGIT